MSRTRVIYDGSVRGSSLVGREGVGAIIEDRVAFVVAPIEHWTAQGANLQFPAPNRVLSMLGVSELRRFAYREESSEMSTDGMVPAAVRFPRALVCMGCDRLYVRGNAIERLQCASCYAARRPSQLLGANWIMICHRGHAYDVYWAGLAHENNLKTATGARTTCDSDQGLYLTTRTKWRKILSKVDGQSTADFDKWSTPSGQRNIYNNGVIGCAECGASSDLRRLGGAQQQSRLCRSKDPWGPDANPVRNMPHCAWPVLRASTQVIQTKGASFLDIEKVSAEPGKRVKAAGAGPAWVHDIESKHKNLQLRKVVTGRVGAEDRNKMAFSCAPGVLKDTSWTAETPSIEQVAGWLSGEVWRDPALSLDALGHARLELLNYRSEEDYVSKMDEWEVLQGAEVRTSNLIITKSKMHNSPPVRNMAGVERFREIRVPLGYSRVHAVRTEGSHACDNPQDCGGAGQSRGVADVTSEWLPAHEVFGEGIYLEIAPQVVESVLEGMELQHSGAVAADLASASFMSQRLDLKMISLPTFPLAHTFSHLLMKEIAFYAGYPLPSIRERIYAKENSSAVGILIYTADGDSEGSLGGLVRLAKEDLITQLIAKMIRRQSWCAQDPICWESKGQGALSLNNAVCHGCAIIPETSCAHSNLRLDRRLIVDAHIGMQKMLGIIGGRRA